MKNAKKIEFIPDYLKDTSQGYSQGYTFAKANRPDQLVQKSVMTNEQIQIETDALDDSIKFSKDKNQKYSNEVIDKQVSQLLKSDKKLA